MPSGAMLRDVRPLDDIRRDLDAGPDEYESREAAQVLGVQKQTLATWRDTGRVTATPHNRTYIFTRDALWRLAQDVHGVALYELDGSDEARAAVLRMIDRWNGGVATIQQLHDAARVKPLPPIVEKRGGHTPQSYEVAECRRCGADFERVMDSDGRWLDLCKSCRSHVTKRAQARAKAFVEWCSNH